ncbi:MAG TPA: hypothetical protein VFG20_06245 [Planctomycetaceae bacterium]|nr:hypothetical protein [Planctomycetaceae bacterium]
MLPFPTEIRILDDHTVHIAAPQAQLREITQYLRDRDLIALEHIAHVAVMAPYKIVLQALMLFPDGHVGA